MNPLPQAAEQEAVFLDLAVFSYRSASKRLAERVRRYPPILLKRVWSVVAFLVIACSTTAAPRKVIIDTDPGTDDAMAIMLALNSPEFDLRALTVVPGNVTAAQGLENGLRRGWPADR